MYKFLSDWPSRSSDPTDILRLNVSLPISFDLEWDANENPDVLGLSDGTLHVSVPYQNGVNYFLELLRKRPDLKITGHSLISADLPMLEKRGIKIPLANVTDTILLHWLVNQHLCKGTGKAALDEENGTELRGRGFMNLATFSSVYTNFPHWKDCRGAACTGPCPEHEPFWYNAIDCAAVAEALPKVQQQAKLRGVDKLYPLHADLMSVLERMREFGVRIDVPYVYPRSMHPLGSTDGSSLEEQFQRERSRIEALLPFNPKSPKAVVQHFKELGLENSQEETVRELVEELGESAPNELGLLLEYKELGNGVGRWFEPQYRDEKGWVRGYLDECGFVHPRLNPFTSSGRLACSSPNFQNIYKRKGEQIRKAVIAPEGWYLLRSDYSNAENRVVLYFAGYEVPKGVDLHTWVAEIAGLTPEMDFVRKIGGGKTRQAAKSVVHACSILEGLQLKEISALQSPKMKAEIKAGARKVYPNWTFNRKAVTFTGVNLARRVYGDATWEHRKQALDIQEQYFGRFPKIREFQKRVSRQCEMEGAVRTPLGYCLLSFGPDEDRMKIAQGVWQQQPVAHATKLALINCWKRWERQKNYRPSLQCHDELICYVKESVDPKVAGEWLREDMEVKVPELPGLGIPADPTWGRSWAEGDQIELT